MESRKKNLEHSCFFFLTENLSQYYHINMYEQQHNSNVDEVDWSFLLMCVDFILLLVQQ
jgi:hypothetical protein